MKIAFVLALAAVAVAKPTDISEEKRKELLKKKQVGDILGETDFRIGPLNAVVDPARCWPNATIPYVLNPGDYNAEEKSKLETAMNDLIDRTKVNGKKCIDIIPRTTQTDYVKVLKGLGSCSSHVGRVGFWQELRMPTWCLNKYGSILHEYLHAFGFHHEHSRSDRDEYVIIHEDNIVEGAQDDFYKFAPEEADLLFTPYDFGSVMHYSQYAWAEDPEKITIETIDPIYQEVIGQREGLSDRDIERVQLLYGCKDIPDSKYFRHLSGKDIGMCKPQVL